MYCYLDIGYVIVMDQKCSPVPNLTTVLKLTSFYVIVYSIV